MKVSSYLPACKIADHVERILVIENYRVTSPFTLPLFANGSPTLLFQTTTGFLSGKANGNITLFGQTLFPDTLTITEDFTLIAYFFKPFSLFSLFGVSAQELTDNPIDLKLLSATKTGVLQERLLNADTTGTMMLLLDEYIFSLITRTKTACQIIKYATDTIVRNTSKDTLNYVQTALNVTERTFQRMFEKYWDTAQPLQAHLPVQCSIYAVEQTGVCEVVRRRV